MKNFCKAFFIIFAVTLIFTATRVSLSEASPNLITNGTASNGMSGWVNPDGLWQTSINYDGVSAYDSYYFHPKGYKGSNGTRIYQDVNVRNYAGMTATFSAMNRAYGNGNDDSMLKIEFIDSRGYLINSASTNVERGTNKWHLMSVSARVPNNAVTARVSLYSFYRTGSEADSYYDNVSLTMS